MSAPGGFHEVHILDMADADAPYVAISELGYLRLDWPKAIFSFMGRHQVDLEHLRFSHVQSGLSLPYHFVRSGDRGI